MLQISIALFSLPADSYEEMKAERLKASSAFKPPPVDEITSNTLYEIFGYKPGSGTKNPPWSCPCCPKGGHGASRLFAHAVQHVDSVPDSALYTSQVLRRGGVPGRVPRRRKRTMSRRHHLPLFDRTPLRLAQRFMARTFGLDPPSSVWRLCAMPFSRVINRSA